MANDPLFDFSVLRAIDPLTFRTDFTESEKGFLVHLKRGNPETRAQCLLCVRAWIALASYVFRAERRGGARSMKLFHETKSSLERLRILYVYAHLMCLSSVRKLP